MNNHSKPLQESLMKHLEIAGGCGKVDITGLSVYSSYSLQHLGSRLLDDFPGLSVIFNDIGISGSGKVRALVFVQVPSRGHRG